MNVRTYRRLSTSIGILLTLLLALLILYRFAPAAALQGLQRIYETRSGVERQRVAAGDVEMDLYRGGAGRPLVLLHGFGDSRLSFLQSAAYLQPHFDVILPEWPGFGDSAQDNRLRYDIGAQCQRLLALLDRLGLQRVHLAGNSMGGHIAAAFALQQPERVDRLVLISPAGVSVAGVIAYQDELRPLTNDAELDASLDQSFAERPWVPEPLRRKMIADSQRLFQWQNSIRRQIRAGPYYSLNGLLPQIKARTLIIWGAQDHTVVAARAPIWRAGITNSTLLILPHRGHAPQYEDPAQIGRILLAFFSEDSVRPNAAP
ncbi:MAG: alpha/beta hydrolase [Leptospirales bacterium]|nr:alpha/beta hydrolase [Leptospirales bacterium]